MWPEYEVFYEREPGWEWMTFTDVPPLPLNEQVRHQHIRRVTRRVIGYIHKD